MKKQVIQQLQNTLEWVMQEWINTKQELAEVRIELEETQEALRRNRNQLESYKMFESLFVAEQVTTTILENSIKSAESALMMYENMSVWKFLLHKYRK